MFGCHANDAWHARGQVFKSLHAVILPLGKPDGQPFSPAQLLTDMSFAAAMLGLPQLTVSLIGGCLFRRFRVVDSLDRFQR